MSEKEDLSKTKTGKNILAKKYFIIMVFILIVLIFGFVFFNQGKFIWNISESSNICGDGTLNQECSENKPYFCDNGVLTEKASVCDCPKNLWKKGDFCYSDYQTNPKDIELKYVLDGKENTIRFTAYQGVSDYLENLSQTIVYLEDEAPELADFKIRNINNELQREMILPLVIRIENLFPEDKSQQVRTAISLVQNINYGYSDKKIDFLNQEINYSRYPYNVLHDSEGICSEKSELLVFLLKEIGYDSAFLFYPEENHEAVGIKCPEKKSLENSEYCYVETTAPAILTDNQMVFVEDIVLSGEPDIINISSSENLVLPENMPEYEDAENFIELRNDLSEKKWVWPFRKIKFSRLKQKYGIMDEEYYLD